MILRLVKKRLKVLFVAVISGVFGLGLIGDFFFNDKASQNPEVLVQQVADNLIADAVNSIPAFPKTARSNLALSHGVDSRSYDRSEFGSWIDEDGDCQNTRHEMLVLYSAEAPTLSRDRCYVLSGIWLDPFSGKRFRDPKQLDIDHIIPLKWAHDAGAAGWPTEKKKLFANDPNNLLVVSARLNRQKGADGPLNWLPPNRAFRCEYIIRFYRIARAYELLNPDAAITLRELKTRECS